MSLRRRRRQRGEKPKAAVDMTSLIDLTFLLLVTFIVTLPKLEQGISIMLPQAKTDALPTKDKKANTIATALANAFSKHSNAKYPEKPHRLTELSEEEKKIEQEKMVENFRAQLIAARDRFDAKHKREQGGEDLGSRKPGI